MKNNIISQSLVALDFNSFFIRSGDEEREFEVKADEYSLFSLNLIYKDGSKVEGTLLDAFDFPVEENLITIEGEYQAEDIVLLTDKKSVSIEVWETKYGMSIFFLDPVKIHQEDFVGRLESNSLNIEIKTEKETLKKDFIFELKEDDEETILIGFKVFYGDHEDVKLASLNCYTVSNFTSIIFSGLIPGAWIEGERKKTIFSSIYYDKVEIYQDNIENEVLIIVS